MQNLNTLDSDVIFKFLEEKCGCNLEKTSITITFSSIRVECEGVCIVYARSKCRKELHSGVQKQLYSLFQKDALNYFLPDIVKDLQNSTARGKMCKGTLGWLKDTVDFLWKNYELVNGDDHAKCSGKD